MGTLRNTMYSDRTFQKFSRPEKCLNIPVLRTIGRFPVGEERFFWRIHAAEDIARPRATSVDAQANTQKFNLT